MKMRYLVVAAAAVVIVAIVAIGTHPWGKTAGEMEGQTTPADVGRTNGN